MDKKFSLNSELESSVQKALTLTSQKEKCVICGNKEYIKPLFYLDSGPYCSEDCQFRGQLSLKDDYRDLESRK